MPPDLDEIAAPGHTVLVTQECQNGVIGAQSPLSELVAAASPIVPRIAELARAARGCGVPVVHCVALRRSDALGANRNARLFSAMAKAGIDLEPGSPGAAVVPDIVDAGDLVLDRYHGVGPMGGTDLDAICRNLGATTIVGVGVSLNIGMLDFAFDAVNAGYHFVLPRDAVAGVPAAYAQAVLDHTLSFVATIVDSGAVVGAWKRSAGQADRYPRRP